MIMMVMIRGTSLRRGATTVNRSLRQARWFKFVLAVWLRLSLLPMNWSRDSSVLVKWISEWRLHVLRFSIWLLISFRISAWFWKKRKSALIRRLLNKWRLVIPHKMFTNLKFYMLYLVTKVKVFVNFIFKSNISYLLFSILLPTVY